jgi:hypothetical protein
VKSTKQTNQRRSVAIKVLLVYLAVALLVLFISSLIGFYLGGTEGATFALGIGILINLLVFPVVGIRLTSRLKAMADEEAASPSPASFTPEKHTSVRKQLKSKQPNSPRENPPA